ncbi:hypothetical protein OL239_12925 [Arthrobacter sp. ATA002]|uniref:hypothetical protein n=1 Tax=Arthrobacter sp. ATA002 TaxID=2991715 RepID=UPI0022A7E5E4|nr:hypothetical protein [Arthrobacter sp. ATA002]WAP50877.1 hypothetical protein OL239_12925 [Arthrobacter sp. ATA002]
MNAETELLLAGPRGRRMCLQITAVLDPAVEGRRRVPACRCKAAGVRFKNRTARFGAGPCWCV